MHTFPRNGRIQQRCGFKGHNKKKQKLFQAKWDRRRFADHQKDQNTWAPVSDHQIHLFHSLSTDQICPK